MLHTAFCVILCVFMANTDCTPEQNWDDCITMLLGRHRTEEQHARGNRPQVNAERLGMQLWMTRVAVVGIHDAGGGLANLARIKR